MSYIGGKGYGYEVVPLSIGLAFTTDPSKPRLWSKIAAPILTNTDRDVRAGETGTLYKSYIVKDEAKSLGARFVIFYNAKPLKRQRANLRGRLRRPAPLEARRHLAGDRESRA